MSKYQNKITKQIAYVKTENNTFLGVCFEDENGIEGGDDENPRVVNKEKFLEKFEKYEEPTTNNKQ